MNTDEMQIRRSALSPCKLNIPSNLLKIECQLVEVSLFYAVPIQSTSRAVLKISLLLPAD